jgi:hypothetical protein
MDSGNRPELVSRERLLTGSRPQACARGVPNLYVDVEGKQVLPDVEVVQSVEMLRDGGSLNASFVATSGKQYWLVFSLKSELGPGGELVRLGYERPVVFERVEARPSAARVEWQPVDQVALSWAEADEFLTRIRQSVQTGSDAKWLDAMEQVARTEGALPHGVERVLDVPRRLE